MPLSPARCSGTMPQPSLGPLPSHTHNCTKLTRFHSYTQADLSGIFNWNVKQLFVYISATYATQSNTFNEVVIWDKVVTSADAAKLVLTEQYNKYPLVDQKAGLRDTPITLSLFWDIMPITGLIKRGHKKVTRVRLPSVYCRETPNQIEDECDFSLLPLEEVDRDSKVGGGGKSWDEL